jgi:hypothetical protein
MRSIGKRNKKLVEKLTLKAIKEGLQGVEEITKKVWEELPAELWETWEGADTEIDRIIEEVVFGNDMEAVK